MQVGWAVAVTNSAVICSRRTMSIIIFQTVLHIAALDRVCIWAQHAEICTHAMVLTCLAVVTCLTDVHEIHVNWVYMQ